MEYDNLGLSLNLAAPSSFPRTTSSKYLLFSTPDTCPTLVSGIDVNRAPSTEDDGGVSSPNSKALTGSGKRGQQDNDSDRACPRSSSDDEDGDLQRKKLRMTKDQSAILEESFKKHNTLNPKQKTALSKQLGLRPRQVEVWFQNRRARTKQKQTEEDYEYLKRCCDWLTEENRRLEKELHELRALNLSPQFIMQMAPPTTLTMCSSCEPVGIPPASGNLPASCYRTGRPMGLASWGPPCRFEGS